MPSTNQQVRRLWTVSLASVALAWTSQGLAAAQPQVAERATAQQITHHNVSALRQRGPDASGGLGDWHLSNGTLCATISAVDHESDLSQRGGVLNDLGFCGRADDQFVAMQDLLNGSIASPVDVYRVEALQGDNSAGILTLSGYGGLVVETRYLVSVDKPTELRIQKTIKRGHSEAPDFFAYVPVLFNYYSMETFVLASTDLSNSNGFLQQSFFDVGATAFSRASRNADTVIALGAKDSLVPISYGWQVLTATRHSDNEVTNLPTFVLSDGGSTARMIGVDSFYVGDGAKLGTLQLLQLPLLGLAPGEEIRTEEVMYIGATADVSAITNQLFPNAPMLRGQINNPQAVVHLDLQESERSIPFSFMNTATDGSFALRAPKGDYQLRVVAPGGLSTTTDLQQSSELAAAGNDLGSIELPAPAQVKLPRQQPMRLVFQGINGTNDPNFEDTLTGFQVFDDTEPRPQPKVPAVFLAGIDSDPQLIAIEPGSYRVFATRGIEYSLTQTEIAVKAGKTVNLNIEPPSRAVTSKGYIAADLHVHSGPSMDNGFSSVERVRTFVAEHGEVMVAAEHETAYDFGPLLETMGVTQSMIAVTGTEMTGQVPTPRMPHTAGHANFFPIPVFEDEFRRGVPANEGRRLREILSDVAQRYPNAVSQLNHARQNDKFLKPWSGDAAEMIDNDAYLDHMGPAKYPFDPRKPIDSEPNQTLIQRDPITGIRDIDFDAMEILNGPHSYSPTRRRALRTDWFALLNQGIHITGTANSDSHGKSQQVALPRNMIAMVDDQIAKFDIDEFTQSIRQGNLYGTTGPLFDIALDTTPMGSTHKGREAMLNVQVRSAAWIGAEQLHIYVNGALAKTLAVQPGDSVSEPLSFSQDSYVVVEIEATPTAEYSTIFPGQVPYAFSNPIYVDADNDGQWRAPGLTP